MKESLKFEIISTFKTILIAVVLAFVIKNFIFTFAYVNGISMEPTLKEKNLLFCFVPKKHSIRRGNIVILKSPLEDHKIYIKRVIGLPGDKINIKDGSVYVNGSLYREDYISNEYTEALNATSVDVGDDEYFVMGDNRNPSSSVDSRMFGPISRKSIKGVVLFRIYPFSKI